MSCTSRSIRARSLPGPRSPPRIQQRSSRTRAIVIMPSGAWRTTRQATSPLAIEAATYVSDLDPPSTWIATVDSTTSTVSIDASGTETGVRGWPSSASQCKVDTEPVQLAGVLPAGANVNGSITATRPVRPSPILIDKNISFSFKGATRLVTINRPGPTPAASSRPCLTGRLPSP